MSTSLAKKRWITRPVVAPEAETRLYAVPYAGSGSGAYRSWCATLAKKGVEATPVRLPGRETRLAEPPDIHPEELVEAVAADIDRPYALFGHSLGARLAFEVCRGLAKRGAPPPVHLFVSGSPAPHLDTGRRDSDLPDSEFVTRVTEMGGTPPEVFDTPELRDLVLPVMKSDFRWVDDYVYLDAPPLESPITAFAGVDDPIGRPEWMREWAQHTSRGFELLTYEGAHFYLHEHQDRLLSDLVRTLKWQGG